MNPINRLEQSWTPRWDLGLQDEFGFFDEKPEEATERDRPSKSTVAWSLATQEVFNRQAVVHRRLGSDASRVGELIAFFETLCKTEESSDE